MIPTIVLSVALFAPVVQGPIPLEFRGDWVARTATCESPVRLRVGETTLTLINDKDTQTWGNVGLPTSFFGPDYKGISVVALPDFDGDQPFTVYFNADEQRGVTKVAIYSEMRGPMNAQVAALQAKAKTLATRFPLNNLALKKCVTAPAKVDSWPSAGSIAVRPSAGRDVPPE